MARHLRNDQLWQMTQVSVARGVSIGMFFGLLLPVGQVFFAMPVAILLRANVPITAASTLVTNPLTFPAVYWLAHRIGARILDRSDPVQTVEEVAQEVEQLTERVSWGDAAWQWIQEAGAPLVVGLSVLSIAGAVIGYLAVCLLWQRRASMPVSKR